MNTRRLVDTADQSVSVAVAAARRLSLSCDFCCGPHGVTLWRRRGLGKFGVDWILFGDGSCSVALLRKRNDTFWTADLAG